ncbi:ABC transporter permease [Helicobacter mustelae]|uniref:Putative ABC-2 type transport system permease protein n=1 Tax=Helicobacter mustelae (strain ATCC 43772 / CCUG 25715 / CIP 103759 / LMG 18044 / NCTC 12198 / R85-136P) TaxID=679897 RepID=D3UJE9_HELM1|nr:ABC transporter permease [Helicobacter mustelae]CBG40625.1 putative ABC-2 type transport system permease protein [Helicobacter mustelae 12198]SQH72123.1 ABC-2 type transport system permease [Helicobacter mustelae]STP13267.1 ABC-2 type transport system permease [Helicobacter mustelae]STP14202.1 ABC-2 type transport system permease [Helicobacter mustelae]
MPRLFLILSHSKFLWILYIVLPLAFCGIIYSIFVDALPRSLPIGVVDEDHSSLSRDLLYAAANSATLKITKQYHSIKEAKEDLSIAKIYALLVIPKNLQKNIKMGVEQSVGFYYNAQFILIGKALDSAMLQIISSINAKLQAGKNLIKATNINMALSQSVPILPHINLLFNAKSNYAQFLVTLILPCIWQILIALGILNLLSYPLKNSKDFWARFGFNLFIFTFWGMAMVYFFAKMDYPLLGSIPLIFLGFVVLGIAISSVVIFLQSLLQEPTRSISFIAAYTAPSLAFAGVTYPQSAMDHFALLWNHILPISYFMEFYFQQANYGGSILGGLEILAKMLPFFGFLFLGFCIYKLRGKI